MPGLTVITGPPFVKFQAMAFRNLSIIRQVSYIAYVKKDEKGFIEQRLVVARC